MVGIGVDLVDVARFGASIARTPGLVSRVFTDREVEACGTGPGRVASLAARWAAKEAVAKVLVDSTGLSWHHCEVLSGHRRQPALHLSGSVEAAAARLGIGSWLVSLSHDGGMAIAFVVARAARGSG
ncbi:MAG: holo-ACP synthase [Actinomycetota bacterium]|nr:holo-ACP synthase [Actinomycetota bacterium]